MSRKNQRDDREDWRRQQQNRQGQNRWSTGGDENDYGRQSRNQEGGNWRRDEEYGRRGNDEMGEGYRGQNMGWSGGRDRDMWQGGRQRGANEGREPYWESRPERGDWQENRGWEREHAGWQGGRGGGWPGDRWQGGGYSNRGEGEYEMESRYGRGDWNRGNWNQGMGGNWNPNQERRRYNQGDWNQAGGIKHRIKADEKTGASEVGCKVSTPAAGPVLSNVRIIGSKKTSTSN